MKFPLSDEAERLIEEKLRSGRYGTAEEVVLAGLGSLEQDERYGDFAVGEWDSLLKAGEKSLVEGKSLDAADTLADIRSRIAK